MAPGQRQDFPIYLVDSSVIDLYVPPLRFETDTSLYFESNRAVARLEGLANPS